ncbi:MAG: ShlB/FhaC/HecB family hemolysin secretion/activation protein [Oryzomonas sp.]|jgi:hemolysin activation/secretion protein
MKKTVSKVLIIRVILTASCGLLLFLQPAFAEETAPDAETATPQPGTEQPAKQAEAAQSREVTFTIRKFAIEGSNLFSEKELQNQVKRFIGRNKTAADVEGARDALERFFHDQGYPTVVVNIPEQKVESRTIRLEIVENRVGTVTVTGNKWFSTEMIMRDIPSLAPGSVIRIRQVQDEVNRLNKNPDLKVIPEMQPGTVPESVNVALKVQETPPVHGSLELNNRASHDTSDLRLNAALRYDNLWQREHSLSVQYQVAPENPDDIQVASGTYSLPAPWDADDRLVMYGVWSNNNTASAAGFNNLGKGTIVGARTILTLRPVADYNHTLVMGFDYKNFEESVGQNGSTAVKTPIEYFPFTVAYSASLSDSAGFTSFNAGVNVAFRGAVTNPHEFEDKRFKARGNYIFMTAGAERTQKLPGDFSLLVKVDGQLADQPLISNEEYMAGGMESVRGYWESELAGDNAIHSVVEFGSPNMLKELGKPGFTLTTYLFYDAAALWVKEPLAGQVALSDIQGTGIGMRGTLYNGFEFQTDVATALRDTSRVAAGDVYYHFKVLYRF